MRLKNEMLVLATTFLMQLDHLGPGFAHQILDLMKLIGIQLQFTIEAIDETVIGGNPQQPMPISDGGQRESDHHARDGS